LGGFQVEHDTIEERIAYLYADARLNERFALFESVALPCLRAQTDPDFTLVIVIGDQFPAHHEARLNALIADIPQAIVHKEPPRNQREVMKEILNEARLAPNEPCLQFRYDDDDAIAVDFIARLRAATRDCAALLDQHRTVAFDWSKGFIGEFGADGIKAADAFIPLNVAALGMYVKGNCAQTIMNYAHHRLPRFMPTVSFPTEAMFVRSHNGFNDARQKKVKEVPVAPLDAKQEALFHARFAIDAETVKRAFSPGSLDTG
jgi:hypothetical protein